MIYDIAPPTHVIETPRVLNERQLEKAREKFAASKGRKRDLEEIARSLGGHVVERGRDTRHVAVDYDQLVAMVGEDKARELLEPAAE